MIEDLEKSTVYSKKKSNNKNLKKKIEFVHNMRFKLRTLVVVVISQALNNTLTLTMKCVTNNKRLNLSHLISMAP